MTHAETLTSLALLKVNQDTRRLDFFDYLAPFVGFVLMRKRPTQVNSPEIKKLVFEEFGLIFPHAAIELVLRRFAGKGYLSLRNQVYTISRDIPLPDIEQRRAEFKRVEKILIHGLQEHAANYGLHWSEEKTAAAIISYISQFSIECLKAYASGSPLPEFKHITFKDLTTVNLYVRHIYETSMDLFDCLVTLVKGHILANALIGPDLQSLPSKFKSVHFYLDTPIILGLLGINGTYKEAIAKELLDLLKNLRGVPCVFEHTHQEVHGVLRACQSLIDNPIHHSRMIDEMRSRGITSSDFDLLRADLERRYDDYGIALRKSPEYDPNYEIDESILEKAIEDEVKYLNPKALIYDVNSIRSVYALRRGKSPVRLEDCGVVLVTSNAALAQVTYQYGQRFESSTEVSVVITDFSLANIAWLKAPLSAPDLPKLEIIANCYAAMEPAEPLWTRYVEEIDKLQKMGTITVEMHQHLRYSRRAGRELVNLTLGSEDAFSEMTVPHIVEKAEEVIAGKHITELQKEHEDHEKTKIELTQVKKNVEKIEGRLLYISSKIGKFAGISALILLGAILLVSSFFSSVYSKSVVGNSRLLAFILTAVVLFGLAFGFLNQFTGISAKKLAKRIEEHAQRKVHGLLLKWFVQ